MVTSSCCPPCSEAFWQCWISMLGQSATASFLPCILPYVYTGRYTPRYSGWTPPDLYRSIWMGVALGKYQHTHSTLCTEASIDWQIHIYKQVNTQSPIPLRCNPNEGHRATPPLRYTCAKQSRSYLHAFIARSLCCTLCHTLRSTHTLSHPHCLLGRHMNASPCACIFTFIHAHNAQGSLHMHTHTN